MLTCNCPDAPCCSVLWIGSKPMSLGAAGETLTLALALELALELALPPLRLAVTLAVPTAWACTGIATLVWPALKATLLGSVSTAVLLETQSMLPALLGAGVRVAVNTALLPLVSAKGFGARRLMLAGGSGTAPATIL